MPNGHKVMAVDLWNEVSEQIQMLVNEAVSSKEPEKDCVTIHQDYSESDRDSANPLGVSDEAKAANLEAPGRDEARQSGNETSEQLGNPWIVSGETLKNDPQGSGSSGDASMHDVQVSTELSEQVVERTSELSTSSLSSGKQTASDKKNVKDEWLNHTETVRVNENPPLLDESEHKKLQKLPDGTIEEIYECEYCCKCFCTPAQLTAHRWHHTKPFQCEVCQDRFPAKGNLVVHRRKHSGERPFGCSRCESRFSTRGNLRRHERCHTGARPWTCSLCQAKFTEKKTLTIHMRKHTGERPFGCPMCHKKFGQSSVLKTHMKLHEDKKPHLCHLCGKSFREKSQLQTHTNRHEGIRKFACDSCKSKFASKGDLERHEKIHTGERPYSCDICVKTFTRLQSLKEHKNRHFGKFPYKCRICGKAYAEMSACHKHVKTHNKERGEVEKSVTPENIAERDQVKVK